jgi:hypothetical protein
MMMSCLSDHAVHILLLLDPRRDDEQVARLRPRQVLLRVAPQAPQVEVARALDDLGGQDAGLRRYPEVVMGVLKGLHKAGFEVVANRVLCIDGRVLKGTRQASKRAQRMVFA